MNYKKFLGAANAALLIVIVITLVLAPDAWAASKYKVLYRFYPAGAHPMPASSWTRPEISSAQPLGAAPMTGAQFSSWRQIRMEAGRRACCTRSTSATDVTLYRPHLRCGRKSLRHGLVRRIRE